MNMAAATRRLIALLVVCSIGRSTALIPERVGGDGGLSQAATPAPPGSSGSTFVADFCPAGAFEIPAGDAAKWVIFDQLTTDEIWDVVNFMVDDMGIFHIRNETWNSTAEMPTPTGPNYLYRVEVLKPPKAAALKYLDEEGPKPKRFAKAIVFRPANDPRDIMEYKVGPLPLQKSGKRTVGKTDANLSPFHGVVVEQLVKDGEIPWAKRPTESISITWADIMVSRIAYKLREIFKDTIGYCYGYDDSTPEKLELTEAECGRDRVDWLQFPSLNRNASRRVTNIHYFFKPLRTGGEEMDLHNIPLTYKLDETGFDQDAFGSFDFEYCHQGPFLSAEALLEAYQSGNITKCVAPEWKDAEYDEKWSRTDVINKIRKGTGRSSPRTFEPDGPRFKIRGKRPGAGHHFSYLGWQGHFGMRYDTGITFHDIRFRGERIAYELSLQEQYVAYSGFGGTGQIVYFDSFYGIGLNTFPLRRGVDCPETAEYVPAVKFHLSGAIVSELDNICIFEEASQTTEWRHTHGKGADGDGPHSDAVRRSMLVIRTIATIGNYDYIYDIRFKPVASIQVDVTMAGYVESSFYSPSGETRRDIPFGTRVHKYTFANLHDHLSGWKVDLDILGGKNSIHKKEVKVGTWKEALKDIDPDTTGPDWHEAPILKYIDSQKIQKEFGYKIQNPGNVVWTFNNDFMTNSVGQPRGYSISHGLTSSQLLPETHPFTKAMAWTKYHLAVTKYKDSEPRSHAGLYDMPIPQKPVVNFDDFLDDESIVAEDLVGWVMVGLQHVPRSEDVPLISNFGTNFHIKPWNYFEELVSMDMGDTEDFPPCAPRAGSAFKYHWAWDPVPNKP
ncbi:hypothetical protein BSKO_06322 [Bryopsis sp. KO-2023]|nr:hypothetical protein BSKO_06322 [Bryopsis sp. KO-2023]